MEDALDFAVAILFPVVLMATQRRPAAELDALFAQLQASASAASARAIVERIWACWLHHDDPGIQRLMNRGLRALEEQRYGQALKVFDEVLERDPDFAEAWNKRATVRYLMGEYAGSVRDIKRVLALEPRHFGALSGLGTIYLIIANDRGALDAFEAVLALHPHLTGIRRQVEALRQALGGAGDA
jgi:tetratricopeptide (TPR) repeat protein